MITRIFALIALLTFSLAVTPFASAQTEATTTVNVSVLNLRAGPSKSSAVLARLTEGQTVAVLGRSQTSQWLNVRTAQGITGWVYTPMVNLSAEVESLPITEARGGATPNGAFSLYTFSMVIENNTATVTLNGFPANSGVALALSRVGGAGRVIVAQGATDANGKAQFTFAMPSRWADSQSVAFGNLALNVVTGDKQINLTATIQYHLQ